MYVLHSVLANRPIRCVFLRSRRGAFWPATIKPGTSIQFINRQLSFAKIHRILCFRTQSRPNRTPMPNASTAIAMKYSVVIKSASISATPKTMNGIGAHNT